MGLQGTSSAVAGAFISYAAATAILCISLMNNKRKSSFSHITRHATGYFFIAGLFSFIAQLFRYISLSLAPASVVGPIISTSPVFVLILSFFFNRKIEVFSRPVIIATATVVIGTFLIA